MRIFKSSEPIAIGVALDGSDISVNLPDDKSYAGVLRAADRIKWSNNSAWAKFGKTSIKHLFVLMLENRSFDHMLGFSNITGMDAETGRPTQSEGLKGN